MTYPAWTPASRPGIIPLHPLTFGTILGRSFTALRQNPRVLLGFALGVQALAYVVLLGVVGLVAWGTFSRLDTLREGTDEYETVLAGSIATTAIVGLVLSLAIGALSAVVQGVVVRDVAHAAVAEKLTLRQLWRQFTPVVWRLIGFALLLVAATLVVFGLLALAIFALAAAAPAAAIALTLILVLATIPVYLWLAVKLLLVPAVIVLERARIFAAIGRSWMLTRGRFWVALGIIVLISLTFGVLSQVVSLPLSFLSLGFTTIISPTGEPDASAIIGFLLAGLATQVLTIVIQSVMLVVQSTASSLVYIDCRMRHEGLDLDLLQYVERRDAGATGLPDPYTVGIGRQLAPRPAPGYPAYPGYPGYAAPGYGQAPGYGPPGYGPPPAYASPPFPSAPPLPPLPEPALPEPPLPEPPVPEPVEGSPPAEPTSTSWTPPGGADDTDRESPWR